MNRLYSTALRLHLKDSMLKRDVPRTNLIKGLISAHQYAQRSAVNVTLTQTLRSAIKQRLKSIEEYQKAQRDDLAKQEQTEIDMIQEFMPKQISEAELEKIVTEEVEKDSSNAIKSSIERLGEKCDAKRIVEAVKKIKLSAAGRS